VGAQSRRRAPSQLFAIPLFAIAIVLVSLSPLVSSHVIRFLVLLSLLGHCVSSIGLLLGCVCPLAIVAVMLCPITVIPFMLTSGFFINLTTIPVYLRWLTAISPHRYAFEGLMALEFHGLRLHCEPDEESSVLVGGDTSRPQHFTFCSMVRGTQVLDLLSLPYQPYTHDCIMLLVLSIAFRVLAGLVLHASVRENKLKMVEWRRKSIVRIREILRRCHHGVRSRWQQLKQRWRRYRSRKRQQQ